MDQDKFRQFLQAPRLGSSSTSGVLGGATPRRGYVAPPTREKKAKDPKPEFQPRKVKKLDGKYKDRAEARRLGLDDEFTEVERMNAEFEQRMQAEAAQRGDDELADLEAKRAYLGGDADHSILVKGLDYALLAKNKADLEAAQAINDDDELEAAFAAASSHAQPESPDANPRKRTREEILAAVQGKKRARAGATTAVAAGGDGGDVRRTAAAEEAEAQLKALNKSKFKPLGFKEPTGKKSKGVELGKDGQPKKLKKKKKKEVVVMGEPGQGAPPSTGSMGPPQLPSISSTGSMLPPPLPLSSSTSSTTPAASTSNSTTSSSSAPPSFQPPVKAYAKPLITATHNNSDDDDDIFGGVGDYEAPDSDSNDEDDPSSHKPSNPSSSVPSTDKPRTVSPVPIKKNNWFSTAPSPSPSPPRIPLPRASKPGPGPSRTRHRSTSRSPSPDPTTMKLVPLSGSRVPSVKDLLRRDEEAQAAAEKKAKKAAWRQKQGLAKQDDDGDDDDDDDVGGVSSRKKKSQEQEEATRLNREYKEYETFMKAKEGGTPSTATTTSS